MQCARVDFLRYESNKKVRRAFIMNASGRINEVVQGVIGMDGKQTLARYASVSVRAHTFHLQGSAH